MTKYKNLGGNSGVLSYEICEDSITVVFNSGPYRNYFYNYGKLGREKVEKMKALADSGQGLNSYIKATVKKDCARRWELNPQILRERTSNGLSLLGNDLSQRLLRTPSQCGQFADHCFYRTSA